MGRTSCLFVIVCIRFLVSSPETNNDELAKSHKLDGTVKSARCKARESLEMRRTYRYVGMTKDEAQRPDGLNRKTFYEAVNNDNVLNRIPMS
jgi:hypothetical protein